MAHTLIERQVQEEKLVLLTKKTFVKVRQSLNRNPGLSDRDRGKKFNISRSLARKMRLKCGYKSYRAIRYPNRTDKQKIDIKKRTRLLYDKILTKHSGCIIMDDETYLKYDFNQLPGPKFYTAVNRKTVSSKYKYKMMDKFGKKAMIWQAICSCGLKSRTFVTSSSMTSSLYIKECLNKRILPLIRSHKCSTKFWPDLATIHYAKDTLAWYKGNKVDFVPKHMNPPNCPQFRPIEKYWGIMKGYLRKSGKVVKNNDLLKKEWEKTSKKVTPKVVQNLMSSIKPKVRAFLRNEE